MRSIVLLFISFLLLITTTGKAQLNHINDQPQLDTGTIENQLDYIITRSSSFKEFQLIRKTSFLRVKEHILDSLKNTQKNWSATNSQNIQLQASIKQLETEVTKLKNDIRVITEEKNSIALLGNEFDKSNYKTIVWSVIIVLILALLFFAYQLKNNRSVTKLTKQELAKMENEFDAFRKKSLKKEQEIMRKLQDEINKNTP